MGFGIYLHMASGKLVADGALLRPKKTLRLEIVEARNAEWTDEEKEKLTREQMLRAVTESCQCSALHSR